MSTPADRGRKWETRVTAYLSDVFGRAAYRPRQEGWSDMGDIHIDPFALQCRDTARLTLSKNIDDAETQAANAGTDYGAAVMPRRGRPVGDAYVAVSLRTFRALVARLRSAEQSLAVADLEAFDRHRERNENP